MYTAILYFLFQLQVLFIVCTALKAHKKTIDIMEHKYIQNIQNK